MDPAHSSPSRGPETPSAIQRLESTEGKVSCMAADMASLLQLSQQQQQQIQQQQQQLAEIANLLSNQPPPAAPAPHQPDSAAPFFTTTTPEPKVGNPERFDGDPAQVRAFLTSCRLQFALQPRTFATEGARVGFAITHLTGRARLWGTAEFERQTAACSSFNLLAEEMLKVFDLGSSTDEASQALMTIRQGRRSVADYSIDFRTLARRSSWNMEALVDVFLHSLADYLKDELVSHDRPSTLDEAIALAVRIDRRVQARRHERGRQTLRDRRSLTTHSTSASANHVESMEIGRASLSPEERQHRFNFNLCLYCGGEGHRVATCPVKDGAHRK